MTSDAQTNACVHYQRHTTDSVFRLALSLLCIMMLHNILSYVRPNIISHGPTNGLSIRQLPKAQTFKLQRANFNFSFLFPTLQNNCTYLDELSAFVAVGAMTGDDLRQVDAARQLERRLKPHDVRHVLVPPRRINLAVE